MHDHHQESIPRGALIAMAALIAVSICAAGVTRLTGNHTVNPPPAKAVESLDLRFSDRADGAIVVIDATNGSVIEVLAPGTHGFVRGILRGLARDRKVHGVGAEPAFTLTRWSDGRHSITDPTTGTVLHLAAYGFANVAEFSSMLSSDDPSTPGALMVKNREVTQ